PRVAPGGGEAIQPDRPLAAGEVAAGVRATRDLQRIGMEESRREQVVHVADRRLVLLGFEGPGELAVAARAPLVGCAKQLRIPLQTEGVAGRRRARRGRRVAAFLRL